MRGDGYAAHRSLSYRKFTLLSAGRILRIENEIGPRIFDEKYGNAALLIKNSGSYFIRDPKQDFG